MSSALLAAHLIAIAVYLGASVLLALLIPSVGTGASSPVERRARYAAVFRAYNPLAVATLGVIVMTGAWSITSYKEAFGPAFFAVVGGALVGKLAIAFFVVMFGVYVCMGIGLRLVRATQGGLPVTDDQLRRQVRRMQTTLWMTLMLVFWAAWIARDIAPAAMAQ
ncbi:MAG: putative membrane protein [Hyphomicrobiaceae bacterium]|jgi:uncharacterized membrane protein